MNSEILKKYKIKGNQEGKHEVSGFGVIDFDKLTLKEADNLFNAKCPIFELKSPEDKKAEKEAAASEKAAANK